MTKYAPIEERRNIPMNFAKNGDRKIRRNFPVSTERKEKIKDTSDIITAETGVSFMRRIP